MENTIFIGSSSEAAANVVGLVKTEIEAVLGAGKAREWDQDFFDQGAITLEAIENLPNEVIGAVLLATPDVECKRLGRQSREPVSNVVFEYGYLSARLTRQRVAICQFDDATLPTDLKSLTIIQAGPYDKDNPPGLPEDARKDLRSWLNRLPPLAGRIPPLCSAAIP